jgi:phenylalanyl-tRNA synthetase beta chain
MVPEVPDVATTGNVLFNNRMRNNISNIMTGYGFSEVFTLSLTDKQVQYSFMNLKEQEHMDLGFTAEKSINMIRTWLLPEIMRCLVENRNRPFPQKMFEIDNVVLPDKKADVRCANHLRFAGAVSDTVADITRIRQTIEGLLDILGIKYSLEAKDHNSFIPGRCASIIVEGKELGFMGELHPKVLDSFGIIMPTAAFEIDFEMLLKLLE